jgi:hypothetical protein
LVKKTHQKFFDKTLMGIEVLFRAIKKNRELCNLQPGKKDQP